MTKKEIFDLGFQRGQNIASWTDIPEIGQKLERSVDWEGIGEIETESDVESAFLMLCAASESSARDFSPFEFTAKELNDLDKPYDVWEVFDAGIDKGFRANLKKRLRAMK